MPRFGRDGSRTRYAGDGIRLGLAALVLAAATWSASAPHRSVVEINVFRLVNSLPGSFAAPLVGLMQLGALAAVPAVAAVAAIGGRHRLARLLLVAGVVAWVAAKVIGHLVDEDPPAIALHGVTLHGATTPGLAFPATHAAVAAALASLSGPYLARPNRRLAWAAVIGVGIARIYVGAHFPMDVIGGMAVGWAVGSIIHLVVGAPRGLPGTTSVTYALDAAGLAVRDIRRVPSPEPGVAMYVATTGTGEVLATKAVSRDRPEADWLYRAWRLIAFGEQGDAQLITSPAHLVDHEAYVLLAAQRAGLRVPNLVTTRSLGAGWSLLARTWVDGTLVSNLAPAALDDDVLGDVWQQVAQLHAFGLAHRALTTDHLVVEPDGHIAIVELGTARLGAPRADQLADIAEIAASLSRIVSPQRVVASAVRTLGPDTVAAALPHLQPLKLTPKTRHAVAERAGLLDELRAELAGATGQEAPPVLRPVSVAARNLLPLVGALFAINLLLPQVGHLDATVTAVRHAQWAWLVVVGMLSALTYLMAAVALRGAANQRLALGRTWAVQVAAAFTNRLTPAGLGGMTTNLRYLEAAGTPRPAAVAAITLDSVAGFLVHTVAIAVLIPLLGAHSPAGVHFSVSELPERWPILLAVVAALVGAGVVVWLSRLHRRVLPPVRVAVAALGATLRHPANAVALFGGSAGVTTCYALALAAAAQAFGLSVGVASVVAVYLGGSAVAAVAPTPGGLGALEASLVAGLTAAGAQAGPAVAAVLAFRLVTFWIPTIPGFLAYRTLHQSGVV